MALTDASQSRTTGYDTSTTSYTAGEEPWNKNIEGYTINQEGTEAVTYQCDWEKWHGMYRNIAELRSTIDTECRWIIGKKFTMDDKTEKITGRIKGKGKDTIRKILFNMLRTSKICGDAFAWIARDKAKRIINLKILDPGTIEIQADKFGIIRKYVQVAEKGHGAMHQANKIVLDEWDPGEIFHLSNNSIADEIHGIPDSEKMQDIVKMRHQAMDDNTLIFHRYGKPTYFFEATTDDETELAAIKDKLDKVKKNFEDALFPKGTLEKIERVSTPQYASLDPLPWMKFLRSYFTESSGVPDLVRGKSDEVSLAAGKLNLLSYKEKIIMQQLEYSEEIDMQLGLDITFEEPPEIDVEVGINNTNESVK